MNHCKIHKLYIPQNIYIEQNFLKKLNVFFQKSTHFIPRPRKRKLIRFVLILNNKLRIVRLRTIILEILENPIES